MLARFCFILCALFFVVESAFTPVSPPLLHKYKSNVVALLGQSRVKLRCRVSNRMGAQYWWTRDGKKIRTSRKYRVNYFRSLRIKNVGASDAGEYVCRAKNDVGESHQTITLIVKDPAKENTTEERKPFFTHLEEMMKRTIIIPAGNKLEIRCSASGRPSPTVAWYKNGKQLKLMPDSSTPIKPSDFVLNFDALRPKHDGKYTCFVSNRLGNISASFDLTVKETILAKPVLQKMKNITAYEGDNVTFTCRAISDRMPHFQWIVKNAKKNNSIEVLNPGLEQDDYICEDKGPRWHCVKLLLLNVSREDERQYYCIAGDVRGWSKETVWLKVLPRRITPEEIILTKPVLQKMENITAYEGDNVTLTCRGFSDALPHFQWIVKNPKKNNSIEVLNPGLEQNDYICEDKRPPWHCAKLLLSNVSREDERQYYCIAGDVRGWSKETVWLKVLPRRFTPEEIEAGKPKFAPDSYVADIGGTVRLKCAFTDWRVEWTMTWQKHGEILQLPTNGRIQSVVGKSSFLVIEHAEKNDTGIYECVASNEFGTVRRELELTVRG